MLYSKRDGVSDGNSATLYGPVMSCKNTIYLVVAGTRLGFYRHILVMHFFPPRHSPPLFLLFSRRLLIIILTSSRDRGG